ncbi:MAG: hypothetical protein ACOYJE_03075 [Bacteroidaceae bacterium]
MCRIIRTIASLLVGALCLSGCKQYTYEVTARNSGMQTASANNDVNVFIEQARQGNTQACLSLANCYRDGDGVESSFFNMLTMYGIYCRRSGIDLESINSYPIPENHRYRLLMNLISDKPEFKSDEINKNLTKMELTLPVEAKVMHELIRFNSDQDTVRCIEAMEKIDQEGSEIAAIIRLFLLEQYNDTVLYEQCLNRLVDRFPFVYLKLGDLHMHRYHYEGHDFVNVQKAVKAYQKADEYGMLPPRYAMCLLEIYRHWIPKGKLQCDDSELLRLEKLARIDY